MENSRVFDIEAAVLGPLRLSYHGNDVTPTAPKLRQVLALLLMQINQTVPATTLIRELWRDQPPKSARTTLQTYILHLRKTLANSLDIDLDTTARQVLLTRPGGYLLRMTPGRLDLHRYEELRREARRAEERGDYHTTARLLREALELWQGPALVDVTIGEVLEPVVRGLSESRMVALEQRIDADIQLGRHQEVLEELAALTAQHRFNENLHRQFMLALHRSGRSCDALGVFQRLRTALADELGLEPSDMLQRTQRAVLAAV